MKFLDRIFDVFSRRPEAKAIAHSFPEKSRKRIFLWVMEIFGNKRAYWRGDDYGQIFFEEIHSMLQKRHGEFNLSGKSGLNPAQDAAYFLQLCAAEEFLDFLEYMFRVECFSRVSLPKDQVVDELNQILREDSLPYHVTRYLQREVVQEATGLIAMGGEGKYIKTIETTFPKVVMRENEPIHQHAIRPALQLLEQPAFEAANREYLSALRDYRDGDWADCLVKCCSAFESSMKILCSEKNWGYQESAPASRLIKTVLEHMELPPFLEQGLVSVATLRNKLSTAHGAGTTTRSPTRSIAHYALNTTASAIVFLAEEAGLI